MNHKDRTVLSKLILQIVLMLALALPGLNRAGEPEARWYLLPEPSFFSHPVKMPIKNAEKTVLIPVIGTGSDVKVPEKAEIDAAFADETGLRKQAETNASAILASLNPEWVRDSKKVIEYGVIQTDYPLAATILTAPELARRFADILGPKLLVIIPNRYTVYLFPALASRYAQYADTFNEGYRATAYPVSREVFEVSETGIRAIGVFEE